jgi:hypothetical protein
MPYFNDEGGKLNNFAAEPKMYQAEPASDSQKRTNLVMAIAGGLLVVGLIVVAKFVG